MCINHLEDKTRCSLKPIKEDDIRNAYKKVVETLVGDWTTLNENIKQTITKEIKNERVRDLRPIQEALTKCRNEILEMYKKKSSGAITQTEYASSYATLSKRVLELEEEEKQITNSNMLVEIEKEKMKKIDDVLEDKEANLTDKYVVRTLLNTIKVIDEKTLKFQFACGG